LVLSASAAAEVQLKPFIGLTYGGGSTFSIGVAAGDTHQCVGVNALWLGEVLGVEADIGHTSGFFDRQGLVVSSGVTTYSGGIVVALPRHIAKYGLRPYFVAGGGLMRAHAEGAVSSALNFDSNLAAVDLGGGATGFIKDTVGVNFDIRHFGSVNGTDRRQGLSIGAEQLSFWRTTVAVAIRF
jgi:hypothetical protein